jgi:DNA mismatch endonuclease (patch repair protein)
MRANRGRDTGPELSLRRALFARGLRFRKHFRIELTDGAVRPDIVFTRAMVAVFVDGCFWHRCPIHASDPKVNSDYWLPKLDANAARDRRVDVSLAAAGWTVVRIWEHEIAATAADRISAILRRPGGESRESTIKPVD